MKEYLKKHYCQCGKEIGYMNFLCGNGRCQSCANKGKNNPNYKEKIKINCSYCNKLLYKIPSQAKLYKNFFCNNERFYLWKKGKAIGINNPNYIHGEGNFPYPLEFTEELKEVIRNRDNYTCQNCGMTEEEHLIVIGTNLHVHHIDHDKQNCQETNLITLCRQCNLRANGNVDYWKNIYSRKILCQKSV